MIIYKYLLCMLGVILALPILGLIALALTLPITVWGILYLVVCSLMVCGLIIAPWIPKYRFVLSLAGLIAIILIVGTRLILAGQNTTARIKMITLPQREGTRWLSYVIDEQDGLVFGETLFHFIGGSSAGEHKNITQSLYQDYSDMRQAQGIVPSPIINTYLNFQSPAAFDVVVMQPEVNRHPEVGVIFLHGYMGNVTAQCWEIAQAVIRFGSVTVCPSTEWRGEWWQPGGQAILQSTFEYLRSRGIKKFYLGGFSNGGFSISRLAPQLENEKGLNGLFFIDGIYDGMSIRETGFPVLIIQGTQDERVPASEVRKIAEAIGDLGTYVEIDSDHFLIMKQPDLVQNAIHTWLEAHQSSK
jgi:pimeloyl-ACP methyl ester carboxylesterase